MIQRNLLAFTPIMGMTVNDPFASIISNLNDTTLYNVAFNGPAEKAPDESTRAFQAAQELMEFDQLLAISECIIMDGRLEGTDDAFYYRFGLILQSGFDYGNFMILCGDCADHLNQVINDFAVSRKNRDDLYTDVLYVLPDEEDSDNLMDNQVVISKALNWINRHGFPSKSIQIDPRVPNDSTTKIFIAFVAGSIVIYDVDNLDDYEKYLLLR